MTEAENLTLDILKKIQSDMVNLNHKVDNGFSSMNLQFAALNEKLLAEMDLRQLAIGLKGFDPFYRFC